MPQHFYINITSHHPYSRQTVRTMSTCRHADLFHILAKYNLFVTAIATVKTALIINGEMFSTGLVPVSLKECDKKSTIIVEPSSKFDFIFFTRMAMTKKQKDYPDELSRWITSDTYIRIWTEDISLQKRQRIFQQPSGLNTFKVHLPATEATPDVPRAAPASLCVLSCCTQGCSSPKQPGMPRVGTSEEHWKWSYYPALRSQSARRATSCPKRRRSEFTFCRGP